MVLTLFYKKTYANYPFFKNVYQQVECLCFFILHAYSVVGTSHLTSFIVTVLDLWAVPQFSSLSLRFTFLVGFVYS